MKPMTMPTKRSGGIPMYTSYEDPPPPMKCERCKTHWPWEWLDWPVLPGREGSIFSGPRWAAPKTNPCGACGTDPNFERKRALDRRVEAAGFPYIPYVLHEALLIRQLMEDDGAFMARVKAHNDRAMGSTDDDIRLKLGVLRTNQEAIDQLLKWNRKRSVMLYGPPGTGKTMLLCALGRLLLNADTQFRRYILDGDELGPEVDLTSIQTERTVLRRQSHRSVAYKRLDALVEEQKDRFKPGGSSPVRRMGKYEGVLFFDELGISSRSSNYEEDVVNHVLGERFDRGLPTVISSNLNPEDFRRRYGERSGSRLRTCIILEIQGPDWRG